MTLTSTILGLHLCLSTYLNEAMTIALWISVVKDLWGYVLFYFLVYWHFNLLTGCSSHSTLHCVLWCSLSPWVNTNLWFVGQGVWRDLELLLNTNCCGHTPGTWSLCLKNVTSVWWDTSIICWRSFFVNICVLVEWVFHEYPSCGLQVIYYWFCAASSSILTVFQGWMDHRYRVKREQIARA